MAKSKIPYCPNCGEQAEREGESKIYCAECDAVFEVTKTGSKITGKGKLSQITETLTAINSRLSKLEGSKDQAGQDPPADENENENENDNEDFI